jgi:hypothetical protein
MAKVAAKTRKEGGEEIATVRIELVGSDPPIWREVEVPTAFTLTELHSVIQAAMGWEDYHLWELTIGGQSYMPPMEDFDELGPKPINANRVRLREVLRPRRTTIAYTYDFGDDWEHRLIVTRIRAGEPGVTYPLYVGGESAAPPEDSGGVFGYYEKLEVMADPDDPEHDWIMEWMGEFDPLSVDEQAIRQRLARLAKRPSGRRVNCAA